jgi:putative hemolysin
MCIGSQLIRPIAALAILIGMTALVACLRTSKPTIAEVTVTPAPTSEIPDGILKSRDSVLDFLRKGANECVPPEQALWTGEAITDPPAGYDVYRFHSGGCAITITTAESTDEPIYHVALGDGATGFCWQAVVGANGQILLTGNAAQSDPTLGNPAKNHCEHQGYKFEIVTKDSGQLCGMCIFEEGHSCNAWAYFHGTCTSENTPTE